MYICSKCGKETPNPDMLCDDCKPKKAEVKKEVVKAKKEVTDEEKKVQVQEDNIENNKPKTNLMHCPDCGNKISRNALQCPHCGCPFEKKEEKEKVLLKNNGMKAVSYITTVIAYILSSAIFGIGCVVPLCWLIYLFVFISGKDAKEYDLSWYIKLRNEFIILTVLGLPIIVLL